MASSRYIPDGGLGNASLTVKLIVFLLWLPVIAVFNGVGWGAAFAFAGVGWHTLQTGHVPDVGALSVPFNPTLTAIGLAAFVGGLYLVLANVTFGSDNVNEAIDQGQEVQEMADGESEDEATDEE